MGENLEVQPQLNIAKKIMDYLLEQRQINSCKIHGSLATERCDQYSDIDLQIDASGYDNGQIVLMLPYILQKQFSLSYVAFAPRFAPDLYVVSLALPQTSIFHFIDIECLATPHVPSLQKEDILQITNRESLFTKLLIGCLKKHLREQDYTVDIKMLARQLHVESQKSIFEMLLDCLTILHEKTEGEVRDIIGQCLTMLQ